MGTHVVSVYVIGLYLITPVIKPFVVKASNKDWLAALGLLFVLSSLFPTLNAAGVGLTGYMIFSTPYLFIYLLGYWLCWKSSTKDLWEQNASDCNHYPMYWDYYHEMLL